MLRSPVIASRTVVVARRVRDPSRLVKGGDAVGMALMVTPMVLGAHVLQQVVVRVATLASDHHWHWAAATPRAYMTQHWCTLSLGSEAAWRVL